MTYENLETLRNFAAKLAAKTVPDWWPDGATRSTYYGIGYGTGDSCGMISGVGGGRNPDGYGEGDGSWADEGFFEERLRRGI